MTRKIEKLIALCWLMVFTVLPSFAQRPREIQVDNPPPDMTDTATLIFIVGIPIILVIGYVFLRNRKA
ncbi:MAG: hypothetical protein ACPG21_05480 [Crocinitomicaceae bacterium]